jgi:NAD-dependent dihydropyrimidine dehydrogenase PreA subunit
MGMFVQIEIDHNKCKNAKNCKICEDVCPVEIFKFKKLEENNERISIIEENEDECIFCNLCLEKCPQGAISIKKLY